MPVASAMSTDLHSHNVMHMTELLLPPIKEEVKIILLLFQKTMKTKIKDLMLSTAFFFVFECYNKLNSQDTNLQILWEVQFYPVVLIAFQLILHLRFSLKKKKDSTS